MGLPVCPVAFGYRVAFDHASSLGLNAQEYEPGGKAAIEIEQVYEFMSELVNSLTNEGEASHGEETRRLASSHA